MATTQLGYKWRIPFSLFMDKNLRIILTLKRLRADLLKFKAMLLFAAKYLDQSTGQDIQLERKSKWNVSRARSQRYRAAEPLTISRLMHCNASRWWLCQYYGSGRLRSDRNNNKTYIVLNYINYMYTQIQEYCIKNCQSAMLTAMKRYHISVHPTFHCCTIPFTYLSHSPSKIEKRGNFWEYYWALK